MTITITQTRDITTCRALRRVVFTEEQGVSVADELDDQDDAAIHLLLTEADRPLGTARLLRGPDYIKIGRVCVLAQARGRGLGAALIREAITVAQGLSGVTTVKLGAQTHALGFYQALGFTAYGPEFDDAGIPHRDMVLTL